MSVTRLAKEPKQYPIDQSPLYKLVGKGQLEKVLGIDLSRIDRLLGEENYRVWMNKRDREIQQPIRWLAVVHRRIATLLSRIDVPDYVFSRKGQSYVENGKQHLGNVPVAKTDISKFYPSTTRVMVRDMFKKRFECAHDIAKLLADICCYEERLPTGSPISGYVAFFASKSMFDEILKLAQAANARMTVYVDDVTLSGPSATKRLISEVQQVIRRSGLKTKQSKTRTFPANAPKPITGTIIAGEKMRLPNARYKKIWETRRALERATRKEKGALQNSLRGHLQQAKQILA